MSHWKPELRALPGDKACVFGSQAVQSPLGRSLGVAVATSQSRGSLGTCLEAKAIVSVYPWGLWPRPLRCLGFGECGSDAETKGQLVWEAEWGGSPPGGGGELELDKSRSLLAGSLTLPFAVSKPWCGFEWGAGALVQRAPVCLGLHSQRAAEQLCSLVGVIELLRAWISSCVKWGSW